MTNSDCNLDLQLQIHFLEQLGDIIIGNAYIKDKNGVYLYHNKNMLNALKADKVIQKNVKSFIGKSDHDLFPKNIADAFAKNDKSVLISRKEIKTEEMADFSKDFKRKFISYKKPLYDLNNNIAGLLGYCVEFTYLKINNNSVSLTRREIQTFAGIYYGMSIKAISALLNLSARTVDDYYESLKFKLQCSNKKQIIERIHQLNISTVLNFVYNDIAAEISN